MAYGPLSLLVTLRPLEVSLAYAIGGEYARRRGVDRNLGICDSDFEVLVGVTAEPFVANRQHQPADQSVGAYGTTHLRS